jgi:hypothetical protein
MPSLDDGKKLKFFVRSKELRVQRFARDAVPSARRETFNFSTLDSAKLGSGQSFKRARPLDSSVGAPMTAGLALQFRAPCGSPGAASQTELETGDAFGLETLWSLLDFEFHRLPFVEGFVSVSLDG